MAYNVLFLCTGNSARSILAEALVNHRLIGRGLFRGFSAGSHPKGEVHPLAIEVLRTNQIDVRDLRSKAWDEFGVAGAPQMDFVFTVCDQAAAETCPVWPGHPITAHWGVPDPAAVTGTDEQKRRAFADAFHTLQRRIELFSSLPIATLSRMSLQQRVSDIGKQ